ncbi:hypothetical protein [Streptomyces sp. NPDC050392]|uniref:hypothetical protein n=1 Tax=Streptomyces sp. NPDC050392 TaxID=3155782 RepID=UPI003419D0C8
MRRSFQVMRAVPRGVCRRGGRGSGAQQTAAAGDLLFLVVGEAMAAAAVSAVLSRLVTNRWVLVVLGACAAVGGA